jgi:hypothetical protein
LRKIFCLAQSESINALISPRVINAKASILHPVGATAGLGLRIAKQWKNHIAGEKKPVLNRTRNWNGVRYE